MRDSTPHRKTYPNISWLIVAVAILLVGYFFALHGVNQDVLRQDELTTYGHIGGMATDGNSMSLADTTASLAELSAQHPPLYFWFANIWGNSVSFDPFVLRLLAVYFGVLTLAVVFRLGSDIGGRMTAVYATLLMATSIVFVFYSHDVRQYTMMVFWAGLVWLIYRHLTRQKHSLSYRQLGFLSLATTCAVYTHYSTLFILIPIGLYHLLFVPKTRNWVKIAVAGALGGVFFLPWLPTALAGFAHTTYEIEIGETRYMFNEYLIEEVIRFWGNGDPVIFIGLIVLGLLAVIFNQRGSRYLLFFLVVTILVILSMNHTLEFIKWIRYVIVFSIPFSLFVGAGLALLQRWWVFGVLSFAVFVPYISTGTTFQNTIDFMQQARTLTIQTSVEFQHLVPILQEQVTPNDVVVPLIRHYALFRYGKHGQMSIEDIYMEKLNLPYVNIYSGTATRQEFILDNVIEAIVDYPIIWMTYTNGSSDEYDDVIEALMFTHRQCDTMDYGTGSVLELFVVKGQNDARCTGLLGERQYGQ